MAQVKIEKVFDAAFFVGELFTQTFGDPPPSIPLHYVAFLAEGGGRFRAVGYYHVTPFAEYGLVGGLCVDPQARGHRVGHALELAALEDPNSRAFKAFFAHVGDPARAMRLGYVATAHPHLVVRWTQVIDEQERTRMIEEVAAVGPF